MIKLFFGLASTAGDRLGHLVRGVQMLRSYGKEAKAVRYFDIVNAAPSADQPPSLYTLLECMSEATPEELTQIVAETEWALGENPLTLRISLVLTGDRRGEGIEPPLQALYEEKRTEGMQIFLSGSEFARICEWGQQLTDSSEGIMGEWPSAAGP